jgi:2-furoyl-CoA dehydrogenase FAD binding subunit
VVVSTAGSRTIPGSELYVGPLESTLHHDEIAVEAFIPALEPGEGVGFEEIARRHGDYALVGVGAVIRVEGDTVVAARAGYLSAADVPTTVDLRAALDGVVSTRSTAAAGELALEHLDPVDDLHATAAYRAQLVRVLTARVLRAAYQDARARTGAVA